MTIQGANTHSDSVYAVPALVGTLPVVLVKRRSIWKRRRLYRGLLSRYKDATPKSC